MGSDLILHKCECGRAVPAIAGSRVFCVCGRESIASGTEAVLKPEPLAQWPTWARAIKRFRVEADIGVGDTAQRLAAKFGGERYKAFRERVGKKCGCSSRQAEWNRLYPYKE